MQHFMWAEHWNLAQCFLGTIGYETAANIWGAGNCKRPNEDPSFGGAWEDIVIAAMEVLDENNQSYPHKRV